MNEFEQTAQLFPKHDAAIRDFANSGMPIEEIRERLANQTFMEWEESGRLSEPSMSSFRDEYSAALDNGTSSYTVLDRFMQENSKYKKDQSVIEKNLKRLNPENFDDINKNYEIGQSSLAAEANTDESSLGRGAASFGHGLIGGFAKFFSGVSDQIGFDAGEELSDDVALWADKGVARNKGFVELEDIDSVKDGLSFVAHTLGAGVPEVLSYLTPSGALSGAAKIISLGGRFAKTAKSLNAVAKVANQAVMTTRMAGESYGNIKDETGEKAQGVAMLTGLAQGMLERVFPESLLKAASVGTKRAIGLAIVNGMASEGLTEYSQEVVGQIALKAIDDNKDVFTGENQWNAFKAGVSGAIVGGGISGAKGSVDYAASDKSKATGEAIADDSKSPDDTPKTDDKGTESPEFKVGQETKLGKVEKIEEGKITFNKDGVQTTTDNKDIANSIISGIDDEKQTKNTDTEKRVDKKAYPQSESQDELSGYEGFSIKKRQAKAEFDITEEPLTDESFSKQELNKAQIARKEVAKPQEKDADQFETIFGKDDRIPSGDREIVSSEVLDHIDELDSQGGATQSQVDQKILEIKNRYAKPVQAPKARTQKKAAPVPEKSNKEQILNVKKIVKIDSVAKIEAVIDSDAIDGLSQKNQNRVLERYNYLLKREGKDKVAALPPRKYIEDSEEAVAGDVPYSIPRKQKQKEPTVLPKETSATSRKPKFLDGDRIIELDDNAEYVDDQERLDYEYSKENIDSLADADREKRTAPSPEKTKKVSEARSWFGIDDDRFQAITDGARHKDQREKTKFQLMSDHMADIEYAINEGNQKEADAIMQSAKDAYNEKHGNPKAVPKPVATEASTNDSGRESSGVQDYDSMSSKELGAERLKGKLKKPQGVKTWDEANAIEALKADDDKKAVDPEQETIGSWEDNGMTFEHIGEVERDGRTFQGIKKTWVKDGKTKTEIAVYSDIEGVKRVKHFADNKDEISKKAKATRERLASEDQRIADEELAKMNPIAPYLETIATQLQKANTKKALNKQFRYHDDIEGSDAKNIRIMTRGQRIAERVDGGSEIILKEYGTFLTAPNDSLQELKTKTEIKFAEFLIAERDEKKIAEEVKSKAQEIDYSAWKPAQLKKEADSRGLEDPKRSWTKAKLIKALIEDDNSLNDETLNEYRGILIAINKGNFGWDDAKKESTLDEGFLSWAKGGRYISGQFSNGAQRVRVTSEGDRETNYYKESDNASKVQKITDGSTEGSDGQERSNSSKKSMVGRSSETKGEADSGDKESSKSSGYIIDVLYGLKRDQLLNLADVMAKELGIPNSGYNRSRKDSISGFIRSAWVKTGKNVIVHEEHNLGRKSAHVKAIAKAEGISTSLAKGKKQEFPRDTPQFAMYASLIRQGREALLSEFSDAQALDVMAGRLTWRQLEDDNSIFIERKAISEIKSVNKDDWLFKYVSSKDGILRKYETPFDNSELENYLPANHTTLAHHKLPVSDRAKKRVLKEIRGSYEKMINAPYFLSMTEAESIVTKMESEVLSGKYQDDTIEDDDSLLSFEHTEDDEFSSDDYENISDDDSESIDNLFSDDKGGTVTVDSKNSIEDLFNVSGDFDAKNSSVDDFLLPQDENTSKGFDQTLSQPKEKGNMDLGEILNEDGKGEELPFSKTMSKGDVEKGNIYQAVADAMKFLNKSKMNLKFVSEGKNGNNGWVEDNTIFINTDQANAKEMKKFLAHEDFVHLMLEQILGTKAYIDLFNKVAKEINKGNTELSAWAAEIREVYEKDTYAKSKVVKGREFADRTMIDIVKGRKIEGQKLEGKKLIDEVIANWYQENLNAKEPSSTFTTLIKDVVRAMRKMFTGERTDIAEIRDILDVAFGKYIKGSVSGTEVRNEFYNNGEIALSKVIGSKAKLYAVHNTTARGIIASDDIDGVPAPSMAISKDGIPFTSFGDITLVGDKNMIDPRGETNVYDADVYSPRQPQPEYDLNKKKLTELEEKYNPLFEEYGLRSVYREVFDQGYDARSYMDYWQRSSGTKIAFLKEKGINIPKKMVHERLYDNTLRKNPDIKSFVKTLPRVRPDWNSEKDFYESLRELRKNHILDGIERVYRQDMSNLEARRMARLEEKAFSEMSFSDSERFLNDLYTLKDNKKVLDDGLITEKVYEKMKKFSDEYELWAYDQIKPLFVNPKIKVGGKKLEYTAKNVTRSMLGSGIKGQEDHAGEGSLRAVATKALNTIEEIHRDSFKIVDKGIMEAYKEASGDRYIDLLSKLSEFYDHERGMDDAHLAIKDMAKGKSSSASLRKYAFSDVPADLVNEISAYIKDLKQSPTEYFEAKVKRAVSLGEFKAAIIPKKQIEGKHVDILERLGVQIYPFNGTEKGWLSAMKKAHKEQNIMFSKKLKPVDTDSKEFKAWFGDSKVVDDKGEPLVVYHGTTSKIDIFDTGAHNQLGSHFAKSSSMAEEFSDGDGGSIYPVYLSVRNFYDIVSDLGDWSDMEMLEEYLSEGNDGPFTDSEFSKFKNPSDVVDGLKKKGYDGVRYENSFEGDTDGMMGSGSQDVYIVFEPTQIKSAISNTGDFDPSNPDIRYSKHLSDATEAVFDDNSIISKAPNWIRSMFPSSIAKENDDMNFWAKNLTSMSFKANEQIKDSAGKLVTRWPKVKEWLDIAKQRVNNRVDLLSSLQTKVKAYQELKDKGKVNKLLTEGDETNTRFMDAELSARGLTAQEIQAYKGVREMFNTVRDTLIADVEVEIDKMMDIFPKDVRPEMRSKRAELKKLRQDKFWTDENSESGKKLAKEASVIEAQLDKLMKKHEKLQGVYEEILDKRNYVANLKKQVGYFPRMREKGIHISYFDKDDGKWHREVFKNDKSDDGEVGARKLMLKLVRSGLSKGKATKDQVEAIKTAWAMGDLTMDERDQQIKDLGKSFFKQELIGDLPEEMFKAGAGDAAMTMMNSAMGETKMSDAHREVANQAIKTMFYSRGWRKHMLRRSDEVIEGYQKEDLNEVINKFMVGFAGITSKAEAARDFQSVLMDLDTKKQPKLYEELVEATREQLRNADASDRMSATLNNVVYHAFLGLRLSSALVNSTQNFLIGIPALSRYMRAEGINTNEGKLAISFAKAMSNASSYMLAKARGKTSAIGITADEFAFLDSEHERVRKNDLTMEMTESLGDNKTKAGKAFSALGKASSFSFGQVETMNRISALLAFQRNMGSAIPKESLSKRAEDFISDVHFDYDKFNHLPLFRNSAMRAAKPIVFGLATYNQFLMEHLYQMAKHDKRGVVTFLVAMMFLRGMPLEELWEKLMLKYGDTHARKAFGDNIGTDMYQMGVIPATLGLDLSGSLSLNFPPTIDLALKAFGVENMNEGPLQQLVGGTIEMTEKLFSGDAGWTKDIPVLAVRSAIKGINEYNNGIETRSGRTITLDGKPIERRWDQAMLTATGLRSSEISAFKDRSYKDSLLKAKWNRKKDLILRAYVKADHAGRRRIMVEIREFNRTARELMREYGRAVRISPITASSIKSKMKEYEVHSYGK